MGGAAGILRDWFGQNGHGAYHTQKASGGSAGSGAGALGKRRRGYRQREPGATAFRPCAAEFMGGERAQRRVGIKAHPQGWWCSLSRQTDLATQVVFYGLLITAQARLRRYLCRGLRWLALQHLEFPHWRGDAAAAHVGRHGLGGYVVPLCMRRVVRGALRLGCSRVRLKSE